MLWGDNGSKTWIIFPVSLRTRSLSLLYQSFTSIGQQYVLKADNSGGRIRTRIPQYKGSAQRRSLSGGSRGRKDYLSSQYHIASLDPYFSIISTLQSLSLCLSFPFQEYRRDGLVSSRSSGMWTSHSYQLFNIYRTGLISLV